MKDSCEKVFFLHLIFLLALFYQTAEADELPYCKPLTGSCGPFLPQIPRKYFAELELTIPKQRQTYIVKELFDHSKFRSSVSIKIAESTEYQYIYDLRIEEYVSIVTDPSTDSNDVLCFAKHINDTSFLGINFLLPQMFDDIGHALTGSGALLHNPEIQFSFVNAASKIKGIPAWQFETCYNPPNMNASLQIDYFWSNPELWSPANGGKSIPLLAQVNEIILDKNGTVKTSAYDYNFIIFETKVDFSDSDFEIPRGVFCINYNQRKPFPKLPEKLSFSTEIIVDIKQNEKKLILNTNEWFDLKSNLLRVDYRTVIPTEIRLFGKREIISILDYHSDVLYKIDRDLKNCTVLPLSKQVESSLNGNKPFSTSDLFKLNVTKFEYTRKSYVRDILCDVWIGQHDIFTYEWYFLSEDWIDDVGVIAEKQVPIQVIKYSNNNNNTDRFITSFFKFDKAYNGFPFDISTCSGISLERHFQLSFTNIIQATGDDLSNIKSTFQKNIAEAISIPQLRVSNLDFVSAADDQTVVEFTLLEKPSVEGKPVDGPDKDDPVLLEAVENLRKAVENQIPTIEIAKISEEKQYSMPISGSLVELDSRDPCRNQVVNSTPKRVAKRSVYDPYTETEIVDTYNSGQVAGLAVGFFLIGALVGGVGMLLVSHFISFKTPGTLSPFRLQFRRGDPNSGDEPSVQMASDNKSDYERLEEEADA